MSERDAQPAAGAAKWLPLATSVALGMALLLFGALKSYSFRFTFGDEHLYNAMSLLVLEGEWPYRDFFLLHPPLGIYLTAGIFSIAGYSLVASKAVPIVAAMVSSLHIHLLGRRTVGPVTGLLGALLFLFTFDVIRGSSHPTGVNVTVAFLLAGTHQVFARRFVLAGVLLGCAALTGVYAVPMMLMLATLLALRSFRDSGRFALSFCVFTGCVVGIFVLVSGAAFWNDVVAHNIEKQAMSHSWYDKFENVFFLNFYAMLGFAPAICWAIGRWACEGRDSGAPEIEPRLPGWVKRIVAFANPWGGDGIGAACLFATFAFGYFFFYSNLKAYFSYYFILVIPWMALLTAYVIVDAARLVGRSAREAFAGARGEAGTVSPAASADPDGAGRISRTARRKLEREARRRRPRAGAARGPGARKLLPLVPAALALLLTFAYRERIGEQRMEGQRDPVRIYRFIPSPYLSDGINRIVERAFWSDVRDRRDPPRGITRYLQHETIFVPTIDRFVEGLRAVCHPGDRIFGEYSLAPFAAAVSDCKVAANLIDTNPAWINSGQSTMSEWIEAYEADAASVAIWRTPSAHSRDRALREYVFGSFPEVMFEWKDSRVGTVQLRRRWR